MTVEAVLEVIDQAPAFAEPQPLSAEDLRKRRPGRAGAGDRTAARLARRRQGQRAAGSQPRAGAIVGAGAVNEAFAKALLDAAAAEAGLIKAIGAKAVKSTIAAAIKVGKKTPRDFSARHILSQPRPGEAGNSAAVRIPSSAEDPPAAVPAAPAPSRPPPSSRPPAFVVRPPRPLRGEANSQAPKREIAPDGDVVGGRGRSRHRGRKTTVRATCAWRSFR